MKKKPPSTPPAIRPNKTSLRTFAQAALKIATDCIESTRTLDGALENGQQLKTMLEGHEWKEFGYHASGGKLYLCIMTENSHAKLSPLFEDYGVKSYGPSNHGLFALLDDATEAGPASGDATKAAS